jgi:hypothetical protein
MRTREPSVTPAGSFTSMRLLLPVRSSVSSITRVAPVNASSTVTWIGCSTSRPFRDVEAVRRVVVVLAPGVPEPNSDSKKSEKPPPPARPEVWRPRMSSRSSAVTVRVRGRPPPPNRSSKSTEAPPAEPKRSYFFRFSASERTSYASLTSLNLSCAFLSGLTSGCSSRASFRYAWRISLSEAVLETPRIA